MNLWRQWKSLLKAQQKQRENYEAWRQGYMVGYNRGRYDESIEWKHALSTASLRATQLPVTDPRMEVVSRQHTQPQQITKPLNIGQTTQPLSLRTIAGASEKRATLPKTRMRHEPKKSPLHEQETDHGQYIDFSHDFLPPKNGT